MAPAVKRSSLYNPARIQHFREEQMQLIRSWKRETDMSESTDLKVRHAAPIEELDEQCLTIDIIDEMGPGSIGTVSSTVPTSVDAIRALQESLQYGKSVFDRRHKEQKLPESSSRGELISSKILAPSTHQTRTDSPHRLPDSSSIAAEAHDTVSTEGISNLEDSLKPSSSNMFVADRCAHPSLDEEEVFRLQTSKNEEARDTRKGSERTLKRSTRRKLKNSMDQQRESRKDSTKMTELINSIGKDRRRIKSAEQDLRVHLKQIGPNLKQIELHPLTVARFLKRHPVPATVSADIQKLQARIKHLEANVRQKQTELRTLERKIISDTTTTHSPPSKSEHGGQPQPADELTSASNQAKSHDHADRFLENLAHEWTLEPAMVQEHSGKSYGDVQHRYLPLSSNTACADKAHQPRPVADMSRWQYPESGSSTEQELRDALARNVAAAEMAAELAGIAAEWVAADA